MAGGRPEGAGSVWNAGNWSWEEKNYTSWSHETIRKKLLAIAAEGPGVTVKVTEVTELKGDVRVAWWGGVAGAWRGVGFERRVHVACARRGGARGGTDGVGVWVRGGLVARSRR
jgi:Activator of Hsp90 ATPase, N-terminal